MQRHERKWLAVMLAIVLAALPASAQAHGCQPGPGNADDQIHYHAFAKYTLNAAIEGVQADLLEREAYVLWDPFNPSRFSSAWTMLSKIGQPRWAQVGWVQYYAWYRYVQVQSVISPGAYNTQTFNAQPIEANTQYRTIYSSSLGTFRFHVNGTLIASHTAYFNPDQGEMFGETNTYANQMPGHIGERMDFTSGKKKISGTWSNYAPNVRGVTDPLQNHHQVRVSDSYFYIYDDRCS
jgi:hypothetical protein